MSIDREYVSRDPLIFGRIAATVPVTDLARALRFYTDVVGLQKTAEANGVVVLKRDAAELHLVHAAGHVATDRLVAHLLVSDAQRLYDHLIDGRAAIVTGMRDTHSGQRAFVFADPDGNRIDVGERV